jgi:hypothetical protein
MFVLLRSLASADGSELGRVRGEFLFAFDILLRFQVCGLSKSGEPSADMLTHQHRHPAT